MLTLNKIITEDKNLKWINLKATDFYADIIYACDKKSWIKFYYGSTYVSQSSRKYLLDKDAVKVETTNVINLTLQSDRPYL